MRSCALIVYAYFCVCWEALDYRSGSSASLSSWKFTQYVPVGERPGWNGSTTRDWRRTVSIGHDGESWRGSLRPNFYPNFAVVVLSSPSLITLNIHMPYFYPVLALGGLWDQNCTLRECLQMNKNWNCWAPSTYIVIHHKNYWTSNLEPLGQGSCVICRITSPLELMLKQKRPMALIL